MADNLISYDFELGAFVGIMAPAGTDPDTLREAALEEMRRRMASEYDSSLMEFIQTFDYETGEETPANEGDRARLGCRQIYQTFDYETGEETPANEGD